MRGGRGVDSEDAGYIFTGYNTMIKPQLPNSYTREEDNFFADIS